MIVRSKQFLSHFTHPFLGKRNQYNKKNYAILYFINILIWFLLIPIKFLEIFGLGSLFNE